MFELGLYVRHSGEPLLHEQVVEPAGSEALQTVPHVIVIGGLGHTPAMAEGLCELVERLCHPHHHLVDPTEEEGTSLLSQRGHVFWRQCKASACWVVR